MRDFSETDRKKKNTRIKILGNPGKLSKEVISRLEDKVKASLGDGYLPCAVAFRIAEEAKVPKVAIGEITDRLGIRITDCQIGCFKVDKTIPDNSAHKNIDGKILIMLETLKEDKELTCANLFNLAQQLRLSPMVIADMANIHGLKIHNCQLGCF